MRRLVIFIIIFALFLAFIVLNLDNKSDVSIGFKTFYNAPVFLSVFFSFVLGMLFSIPLLLGGKNKKHPLNEENSDEPVKKKHSLFRGRKKDNFSDSDPSRNGRIHMEEEKNAHIKKEDASYGID